MFKYFINVNVNIFIRLNVHKPKIILKSINFPNFDKLWKRYPILNYGAFKNSNNRIRWLEIKIR